MSAVGEYKIEWFEFWILKLAILTLSILTDQYFFNIEG